MPALGPRFASQLLLLFPAYVLHGFLPLHLEHSLQNLLVLFLTLLLLIKVPWLSSLIARCEVERSSWDYSGSCAILLAAQYYQPTNCYSLLLATNYLVASKVVM